jgi:hypothetical protein
MDKAHLQEIASRMQKYPDITETITPWADTYFPNGSCVACGWAAPSQIKNIKTYAHFELCDVYTEDERVNGLKDWEAAYEGKAYVPVPVVRDDVEING